MMGDEPDLRLIESDDAPVLPSAAALEGNIAVLREQMDLLLNREAMAALPSALNEALSFFATYLDGVAIYMLELSRFIEHSEAVRDATPDDS